MALEEPMSNVHLGCCGYDELAEKPPTTQPLSYPRKMAQSAAAKQRSPNGGVTRPVYSMSGATAVRFPVLNLPPGR